MGDACDTEKGWKANWGIIVAGVVLLTFILLMLFHSPTRNWVESQSKNTTSTEQAP